MTNIATDEMIGTHLDHDVVLDASVSRAEPQQGVAGHDRDRHAGVAQTLGKLILK